MDNLANFSMPVEFWMENAPPLAGCYNCNALSLVVVYYKKRKK